MMKVHVVRAHLEGEHRNLRVLAEQFDSDLACVWQDGDQPDSPWLLGAEELEHLWGQPVALHEAAVALLRRLNGAAQVVRPGYRPVRVAARYDGPGNSVSVATIGTATAECSAGSVTVYAVGGVPVPPSPPPGPGLVDLGGRHRDLAEVLELMGPPDKLSTGDMWKVVDIVRENVGGPQKGVRRQPCWPLGGLHRTSGRA